MAKRLLTSVSAQLDGIGKALIAFAGVAYSVGFVLVNFDLARYRVTGFSLARPQYVLVGAVWSILTAIALVPPFLIAYGTKYGEFKSKLERIRFVIIWLSASLWFLNGAVQFLKPDRSLERWEYYPGLILTELVPFGLTLYALLPAKSSASEQTNTGATLDPPPRWMARSFNLIIYCLCSISVWTIPYRQVFRSVESSRGGASHPKAHVVFRQPEPGREKELKDALGGLTLVGLKTQDDVVVVLVDTDFVVLVPQEHDRVSGEQRTNTRFPSVWKELAEDLWEGFRNPFGGEESELPESLLINKALVASILYERDAGE
jgi:hypothetical protein